MTATDLSHIPAPAVPRERVAFTLSAMAAVLWGSNFEATRIALQGLPPWTAASARFVIAAAAILVWMLIVERTGWRALRRNAPAFAVLGILGVAGFNASLFLGMRTSSPVTAALILGTVPLTTNLLDALFSLRWPNRIALLGMAISLAGIALTVGAFSGARVAPGDPVIFAGSIAWAIYTIGCRRWVREASPLATSTWTMVFGALALVGAAFAFEAPVAAVAASSAPAWGAVVWMALAGSVLTYLFWQEGIAVRGPAATSVLLNLVPVAALVFAMMLGRRPDATQVAGMAIAIFGVLLASGRLRRPRVCRRHDAAAPAADDTASHVPMVLKPAWRTNQPFSASPVSGWVTPGPVNKRGH
ncbi:MAG: EamA family transporter [Limimaricola sp.]|uniref:DMT family transporter n=1 Tax=Limimaricola sp. TaxID=2211665 RepID=UPI001DA84526|nr:DMT family transporter [Limimaricola sp.]MBI1417495.1 EamA family transporter [Limimaricola sp.]